TSAPSSPAPSSPSAPNPAPPTPAPPPTAALLFAGRAVVVDHQEKCLFLLTLAAANHPASAEEAALWVQDVRAALAALPRANQDPPGPPAPAPAFALRAGEARYKTMIAASRTEIREGNSYAVCLTTQLEAGTPQRLDAWDCYR